MKAFEFVEVLSGDKQGCVHECKGESAARTIRSRAAAYGQSQKKKKNLCNLDIRDYSQTAQGRRLKAGTSRSRNRDDCTGHPDQAREEKHIHYNSHAQQSLVALLHMAGPRDVASGVKNLCQTFARPITSIEVFLLEHYIHHLVSDEYAAKAHGGDSRALFRQVRPQWIQWSLANQSILDATMMVASRSLLFLEPQNQTYRMAFLKYYAECLSAGRTFLSSSASSCSDTAIALIMVLAAEQQISQNPDGFRLHGDAILNMLKMRETPGAAPLPSFLHHFLAWSVLNPKYHLVHGPTKEH